jgi:hypothetical protein
MVYAICHEGIWGSGCIDPHFLDISTNWRWMVSFTTLLLYPQGNSPQYPLDRRLSRPQSRSGRHEDKNSWPYWDSISDPLVVQAVASLGLQGNSFPSPAWYQQRETKPLYEIQKYCLRYRLFRNLNSSVSIGTVVLWAGWPRIWGSIPRRAKRFYLHHCVQSISGAFLTWCPVGIMASFPGSKVANIWS